MFKTCVSFWGVWELASPPCFPQAGRCPAGAWSQCDGFGTFGCCPFCSGGRLCLLQPAYQHKPRWCLFRKQTKSALSQQEKLVLQGTRTARQARCVLWFSLKYTSGAVALVVRSSVGHWKPRINECTLNWHWKMIFSFQSVCSATRWVPVLCSVCVGGGSGVGSEPAAGMPWGPWRCSVGWCWWAPCHCPLPGCTEWLLAVGRGQVTGLIHYIAFRVGKKSVAAKFISFLIPCSHLITLLFLWAC